MDAASLNRPLARLLRPLVRLLISRGVTFPAFADLLRAVYVDVAARDFQLDGKQQTDSRVSILTGVHRKEVRRLREEAANPDDAPAAPSLGSQIVALWVGADPFLDERGRPRPLPRSGPAPSFESLVEAVTKDVRPRAILDDWLDRGIATIDGDDRVMLATSAYVPPPGDKESLYYFGRNLGDHIAAAADNILGPEPRFLERAVHYDGLTPEAAAELERIGRDGAMDLLLAVNRRALDLVNGQGEAASGAPARRVNLGLYLYVADDHGDGQR